MHLAPTLWYATRSELPGIFLLDGGMRTIAIYYRPCSEEIHQCRKLIDLMWTALCSLPVMNRKKGGEIKLHVLIIPVQIMGGPRDHSSLVV